LKIRIRGSKSYEYKSFELRIEKSYKSAINTVLSNDRKSNYGIKFDSVFNQLQNFHVCKSGLPPCLDHDLMEGIVAYDLAHSARISTKNWFIYEELNCKIEKFSLSPEDFRNKPVKIQSNCDRIVGGAWEI